MIDERKHLFNIGKIERRYERNNRLSHASNILVKENDRVNGNLSRNQSNGLEKMLPKAFLSMQPEFMVKVTGDSMKDADIREGDTVKVATNVPIYDSDTVLVMIDGEITLKTYCEDGNGIPWLLPQNEAYDAFPLQKGQNNIWMIGKVTAVLKDAPRVNYRTCMKKIELAKQKLAKSKENYMISEERVAWAIKEIAPMVEKLRQWYAVYRPLVEMGVVEEGGYDEFCRLVSATLPDHEKLPYSSEVQRMAVGSFVKPLALWREDNAPVQGKRFYEYQRIAKQMLDFLKAKQ